VRRPKDYRRFFISKAGPPPHVRIGNQLAQKRYQGGARFSEVALTVAPYAEVMTLTFAPAPNTELQCLRMGQLIPADGTLRVFDILRTPADNAATLTFQIEKEQLRLKIPANSELTYGEVLRMVHSQNAATFEAMHLRTFRAGYKHLHPSPLALPELLRRQKALEGKMDESSTKDAAYIKWILTDMYLF
jgi:hypothetical protein